MVLATPPAVVTRVYPSSPSIPEALLRISIAFAAPQRDIVANLVRLRFADGTYAYAPFADPPLWSPDRRMLTLLLDPSRQKTGLADHLQYGFVLRRAQRVELMLGNRSIAKWYVRRGTCSLPVLSNWRIVPPPRGTLQPLIVQFPVPIDALSVDDIVVVDPRHDVVSGTAALGNGEQTWSYTPRAPWSSELALAINPRLEDPCGDELDEPFEHAAGAGLGSERYTKFLRVPSVNTSATLAWRFYSIRW